MSLDFLPEASSELYEAADYYENKEAGLGRRFRNEILEVCRLMVQQPVLWRERRGGCRRVNCPVFPYYVAYFSRQSFVLRAAHPQERILHPRLGMLSVMA